MSDQDDPNLSDYLDSLTALAEAVRLSSPTEAVRLLVQLSTFSPIVRSDAEKVNLLAIRTSVISSLGFALSEIEPVSSNEAAAMLDVAIPIFDQLILDLSDANVLGVASEVRTLKANVVAFFENLVVTKPEIINVTYNVSLPASVIAYKLYRDATRADELVANNPVTNPLFMPQTVQALSN